MPSLLATKANLTATRVTFAILTTLCAMTFQSMDYHWAKQGEALTFNRSHHLRFSIKKVLLLFLQRETSWKWAHFRAKTSLNNALTIISYALRSKSLQGCKMLNLEDISPDPIKICQHKSRFHYLQFLYLFLVFSVGITEMGFFFSPLPGCVAVTIAYLFRYIKHGKFSK